MKKTECELVYGAEATGLQLDKAAIRKMVLYEKDPAKHVARIIFNRPERLNAVPVAALELVGDYVKEAEVDDDIKVIIFKGNGPCFGTGGDAAELGYYIGYKSGTTAEERRRPSQRQRVLPDRNIVFGAFEKTIMECVKATICQVHSYCYGGHVQIALASDIVIASPDAQFTHPAFRYLGPSPQDMYLWIETIGIRKMKEIMLTMRPLRADEAEQCGMVTKVVPSDELEQWVNDYAEAIAVMPLDAIVMGKATMQLAMEARGKGVGSMCGWVGHGWSTNLRFEPGEWSFVKARRDKGLAQALKERDEMVAPFFRLGGKV